MRRRREIDPFRTPLTDECRTEVLNRLKSARGHLDHVIAVVEGEPLALDLMRQVAAVRGALAATLRILLRFYAEHVFSGAMRAGLTDAALDELLAALALAKVSE